MQKTICLKKYISCMSIKSPMRLWWFPLFNTRTVPRGLKGILPQHEFLFVSKNHLSLIVNIQPTW